MSESTKAVSLRLSAAERAAIRQAMQSHAGPEKRRDRRTQLDDSFQLLIRVADEGPMMAVTPRDISAGGIGFYHVAYIHPGTKVFVVMKGKKHDAVQTAGTVTRCEHVNGRVHAVGVIFEQRIAVSVVVEEEEEAASESRLEPAQVYEQVTKLSDQLKALAAEKAEMDAILTRVGELALLLVQNGGTPPENVKNEPAKPKADADPNAGGGGRGPSRR